MITLLFIFDKKNIFDEKNRKSSLIFYIVIILEFVLSLLLMNIKNGSGSWAFAMFYNMILVWIFFIIFNIFNIFKIMKLICGKYIDPAIKNSINNK